MIKGRKRHLLTDTNGLLLGVVVTPASVQDRDGAKLLLCMFCQRFMILLIIFANGGYAEKLEEFVQSMAGSSAMARALAWASSRSSKIRKASSLLPGRWIIKRSFGWLVKQRCLTRDHEKNPRHHEAFVYLAFIGIMTQRLATLQSVQPFAG